MIPYPRSERKCDMAKYDVTHACGHQQTHQLVGPHKDRERKVGWLETTDCSECYQAERLRQREAALEAAVVQAKEFELPALVGSEKQIAWAIQLRADFVAQLETDAESVCMEILRWRSAEQEEFREWCAEKGVSASPSSEQKSGARGGCPRPGLCVDRKADVVPLVARLAGPLPDCGRERSVQ